MTRAASAPVSDENSHLRRRLPHGGLIDRSTPLPFTFDGASYLGFAGDTLASALVANGVGLVGRSFKYHRPRGAFTAGPEEPKRSSSCATVPAASRTRAPRWSSCSMASLQRARTVGRRSPSM
jgi:2Fe-2S iron-sulfur cluster binding domain